MDDPFILSYQSSELQIAAEFLTTWLPFLSRDLCVGCTKTLSNRIRSLVPDAPGDPDPSHSEKFANLSLKDSESPHNHDNCDANSLGSWKDANLSTNDENQDNCDTNSLGSWKDGPNDWSGSVPSGDPSPSVRKSWADMAQEDELEEEGEEGDSNSNAAEADAKVQEKPPPLSRDRREYIRFMRVVRKKDYICLERVKGKIVNIVDGLELHTGIFSAPEQRRIVNFVYSIQEMGKRGELKERTYSEPMKWMRGKGRVTIQFGCCYNYAPDRKGNPPGILRNEVVDPIPRLFKGIIRRLVGWHVLPPSCIPDSCIVNIYEEGDCIPPHIDSHDFVRPFCTVSFLSECKIVFGSNLKILGPGEFSGSYSIPLPVGSALVLNGNGADVAKHCVPAVPNKRISITFRKMEDRKRPRGFVPEPDLQGIQPLTYDLNKPERDRFRKPQSNTNRRVIVEGISAGERQSAGRAAHPEQGRLQTQAKRGC
ncbi:hypothetical protein AAC387_Pa05g3665 [Persea americana]|eukprot:TRINITY_DN8462_c0_g1_i5.p1 TRINITY_DN8462_c0_g1~~TRINITY_DN8462_c0_g1_i5.p1  ORF type:complete len:481 (-),score=88.15 TRINITY_DN8462_c0_g1_i5:2040-3482(-)